MTSPLFPVDDEWLQEKLVRFGITFGNAVDQTMRSAAIWLPEISCWQSH